MGLWTLWSIGPAAATAAREAERGNRETLERAGCPYEEDLAAAEPVRLPVTATAAGVVALWRFNDLLTWVQRRTKRRSRRPIA